MGNTKQGIRCEQLIHAIHLPFRIVHKETPHGGHTPLDQTRVRLAHSPWRDKAPAQSGWDRYRQYQAAAYFHPFVRRFLFDDQQVARLYRSDVDAVQIHWPDRAEPIRLAVETCELILFQPDIGVLRLVVASAEPLPLADVQTLLDSLRRIYPPYLDDYGGPWRAGHCPARVQFLDEQGQPLGPVGDYAAKDHLDGYVAELLDAKRIPWADHWRFLLQNFPDDSIHQLGDDRAPILTWLALDDPTALDRGDWMRLAFADAPGGDPLPYAGAFMTAFETDYCYDRFWFKPVESRDLPSRILNCGYAFAYVGSSRDTGFFMNEKNGAPAIFRHIHLEMGLVAHFQKAALLAASERLTEMVHREGAQVKLPKQDAVRAFYDRFVEFTQTYWFDEISPQEQGIQLFQQWRRHLRIQELYDEVRQELKDLVDYTELRATDTMNKKLSFIAKAGFGIAIASLAAGIFGMNKPDGLSAQVFDCVTYGALAGVVLAAFVIWHRYKKLPE